MSLFDNIPEGTDIIEVRKKVNKMLSEARKKAKPPKCILCGKEQSSFCNSHSVPQMCLRPIADRGKVLHASLAMGFDIGVVDLDGGVNKSGTFNYICRECDAKFFQDYENPDNIIQPPTDKILAEIAVKNMLLQLNKRANEQELIQVVQREFGTYENPDELSKIKNLDQKEYKEEVLFHQDIAKNNKAGGYQILFWKVLPYKVPIATQSAIVLPYDMEGNILNEIYNFDESVRMQYMHIAVFPLEDESVVLAFYHKRDKLYRQLRHQINSSSQEKVLNKVFISGALDPKSPHSYRGYFNRKPRNSKFKNGEWFIMQLAKRIIDDGYDIVNGFGVGIGNYIVSGAYMGGSQRGGADYVSKHLTIQPLISVEQQERDKKDEVRRKLIRDCGTVIFLFGKTLYEDNNSKKDELDKDGTYLEYEIAVEEIKNIIPVGATGLTSRYIYNEVYRENKHKPFIDRLNKENINIMQLIDDIMSMIESEKHKKEQNLKKTLMKDAFSNDDTSGYDVYNQINVFVSFHFAGANQQSRLILSVLDDEPGINPVKESGKIADKRKIQQWIDRKIKSTSVTILILSKGMTKSRWVGIEIKKSIEENNKFVLIDISSGQYDKDFLSQYKIGSKSLDEIYPIHSVENCNEKEGFADVGKWVRDAVADI